MGNRSKKTGGPILKQRPKAASATASGASSSWMTFVKWSLGIGGWLVSAALGILQLPEKITSFSEHLPAAQEVVGVRFSNYRTFQGRFSSDDAAWTERNLMGPEKPPTDFGAVQLDLTYVDGGRYEGEFYSRHISDNSPFPWSRIMVDGYVTTGGKFRGTVWDVVQNQRVDYSSFTLEVVDSKSRILRLKPDVEGDPVLPDEISLWPTDYEMAEGEPGKQFYQMIREVRQRVAPNLKPSRPQPIGQERPKSNP